MSKKKFASLDNVFTTTNTIHTVSIKKYHSNYDYTDISIEDKEKLINSEEEITINRDEINKGYFKIAKDLYEANNILASYDKTHGKFISWFEGVGLKKTFVYNSIKRFELFLLTNEENIVNRLSQKAVEMIGSKKIDDSLKIKLLKEDGIEKRSDKELRDYIFNIISEHSEMIKETHIEEAEIIEDFIAFEKFEKELKKIEDILPKIEVKLINGGNKQALNKIKQAYDLLKSL